jgi:deoxyribose-phosphate aldolase
VFSTLSPLFAPPNLRPLSSKRALGLERSEDDDRRPPCDYVPRPMSDAASPLALQRTIDHALLRPNLTQVELEAGIQVGLRLKVASICLLPHYLSRCVELTRESEVRASTVIGFPHGSITREAKLFETRDAIEKGCEELDVVVNISRVLSNDWDYVQADMKGVIDASHEAGRKVKVIFENAYLSEGHKLKLIDLCAELGADWIKTSTGFAKSGATLEDVRLMRSRAPAQMQVKASGGISDLVTLRSFLEAGASRVGTSSAEMILAEWTSPS